MRLIILYEDSDLIVIRKPAGVESQRSRGFSQDCVSLLQNYFAKSKRTEHASRPPYVGVVHRLDKPVSGVMVFAKTKEAAAKLSSQFSKPGLKKTYFALVTLSEGGADAVLEELLSGKTVLMEDHLIFDSGSNTSRVADPSEKDAKKAVLRAGLIPDDSSLYKDAFSQLSWKTDQNPPADHADTKYALLQIGLETGRHHQIRVQLSSRGLPIVGDRRYGNPSGQPGFPTCLCAWELTFVHPRTGKKMTFSYSDPGITSA